MSFMMFSGLLLQNLWKRYWTEERKLSAAPTSLYSHILYDILQLEYHADIHYVRTLNHTAVKNSEDAGEERGLFQTPFFAGPIFGSLRFSGAGSGRARSAHLGT